MRLSRWPETASFYWNMLPDQVFILLIPNAFIFLLEFPAKLLKFPFHVIGFGNLAPRMVFVLLKLIGPLPSPVVVTFKTLHVVEELAVFLLNSLDFC